MHWIIGSIGHSICAHRTNIYLHHLSASPPPFPYHFPCSSSLSSLWQMAAKHLNSCPHCHFNSLLSQVFCASHKYLSAVNVMNLIEPQSYPPSPHSQPLVTSTSSSHICDSFNISAFQLRTFNMFGLINRFEFMPA